MKSKIYRLEFVVCALGLFWYGPADASLCADAVKKLFGVQPVNKMLLRVSAKPFRGAIKIRMRYLKKYKCAYVREFCVLPKARELHKSLKLPKTFYAHAKKI